MNNKRITTIQETIATATTQLDECKETLLQLQSELNRLTVSGAGTASSKRKKKKKFTPPPLKIGDLVQSQTRPNLYRVGRITGQAPNFFIVTPDDPKYKPFRKASHNLADLSLSGR